MIYEGRVELNGFGKVGYRFVVVALLSIRTAPIVVSDCIVRCVVRV